MNTTANLTATETERVSGSCRQYELARVPFWQTAARV